MQCWKRWVVLWREQMGWKLNETDQSALGFWFSFFISSNYYLLLKGGALKFKNCWPTKVDFQTFCCHFWSPAFIPAAHVSQTQRKMRQIGTILAIGGMDSPKNDSCSPRGRPNVYARICKHQKVRTEMWASNKNQTGVHRHQPLSLQQWSQSVWILEIKKLWDFNLFRVWKTQTHQH